MQTQSEIRVLEFKLRKFTHRLNLTGWMSLVVQLALAIAAGATLGLAIQSPNLNEATTPGIAIGVFWAICGFIVLLGGIYLAFRLTHVARQLRRTSASATHPVKSEITQVLRTSVMVGLIGMLLMIVGEGVTLIALLVKAVTQPQPGAIYHVNELIRPLDILVAISNVSGITAHFTAILTSLSLLNWLQRP